MNATAMAGSGDAGSNLAGRQLGRYEVLTQLAAGGMAAVYIARAQGVAGFERLVAIKVLHPHLAYEHEFISMFLDEARLAARIRHPNVVATLDISDSQGDGYFLVMDYIEGDHLGALLGRAAKRGKRVPSPVVLRVLIEGLAGLGAAHNLTDELGQPLHLVHRDVSPHNLMVGSDGIARLTDFGVAKAEVRMASTRAGQFKGKLSYMAPEQASTGEADQRSDLFSMAIILWESLTGRRLFRGENNAATLTKILQDPIPPPSELWPELAPFDSVLVKALDRDPAKRFQTADEFIEAIEEAAPRLEGIASPRQVASMVVDLLTDKIGEEQRRVRLAIEQLGRSQIGEARLPIPRDGSQASSVAQLRRDPTGASRVAPLPEAEAPAGSKKVWVVAAVAAALLVGGVVAWRLTRTEAPVATPAPIAAPATSAAVAPPEAAPSQATSAVAVPTAAAPTGATDPTAAAPAADDEAAANDDAAEESAEGRHHGRARATITGRGRTASRGTTDRAERPAPAQPAPAAAAPQQPAQTQPRERPANQDLFLNPYRR